MSIFYKGCEFNPFISYTDVIASYVDDMISIHRAKLSDAEVRRVLDPYSFDTTVFVFVRSSMPYCTWKMNQTINLSRYLQRPIAYLAIDRLITDGLDREQNEPVVDKPRSQDATV